MVYGSRQFEPPVSPDLIRKVRDRARPLETQRDLGLLTDACGRRRLALLGESTHGTSEFYSLRALISQALIRDHGFRFIAVEGDWPDCHLIDRWIKGDPLMPENPFDVLSSFQRWPTWMWANEEVASLMTWLRRYNDDLPDGEKVGFYGLDVYSLYESISSLLGYLQRYDPASVGTAKMVAACFEPYARDAVNYARATALTPESCEQEVVRLLVQINAARLRGLALGQEVELQIGQNTRVIRNAEKYYRAMVRSHAGSWNIRDEHMTETLAALLRFHGPESKAVVWEHNTHVGDARFTDMEDDNRKNVGQMVREYYTEEQVFIVGFGSHRGTVIAAREWAAPFGTMTMPPARPGSWEDIMHRATATNAVLMFDGTAQDHEWLATRGNRAVGVVYRPEYEHLGNYVPTVLPLRYDSFVFIDESQALHPLGISGERGRDLPETFPFAY
jgi:erythromycin esterase-like protein